MANIPNNYNVLVYTATAGQTDFIITWPYQTEGAVYFTINRDDSKRLLGEYTVTPAGDLSGGTLSLNEGLQEDDEVVIYRKDLAQQLVLFKNNAKLTGSMIEKENNNIFYILQSITENYFNLTDIYQVADFINNTVIPSIPDASVNTKGLIKLANQSEVDAGEDNTKAITPLTFDTRLEQRLLQYNGGEAASSDISKAGSSNGVVSGLKLREQAGVLKIEKGYGYQSEARRYAKKPSDINVYPVSLTSEAEINSWNSDGIKHIYLVNGDVPYYQDIKEEPPTILHIYLGYVLIEGGVVVKAFSKPDVSVNVAERFNLELDRNTRFENVEIEKEFFIFDRGLNLSSGYNIISKSCNYNGELNNWNYQDIDKIEGGLGTNSFIEIGFTNDGASQELISSSSSNVNQLELINKINDASNSLVHKTLTTQFTNLRILLSSKGELAVQRGQYDYADVDSALEAIKNEDYTLLPSFSDFTPIYALTVQAGVTTFADAVLTKLINVEAANAVDYIKSSPTGSYHKLHYSTANQYEELIEAAGQNNISVTERPELAELQEYVTATLTDNLTDDNTVFNTANDTDNASLTSSCRIQSSVYYIPVSTGTGIYRILQTGSVVQNTAYSSDTFASEAIIIPKNGDATDVLIVKSAGAGGIESERYNLNVGPIQGTIPLSLNDIGAGHYNNNLSKWLIFGNFGSSFRIISTSDAFIYTTELTSSAYSECYDSYGSKGGLDSYENGDICYLNGKYYINMTSKRILMIDENDLTTLNVAHTYTSSNSSIKKVRIVDGVIVAGRGYNTTTKTAELTYSTDGVNWTDIDITLPASTTNNWFDFFVVDSETLLIDIDEREVFLVKDFKGTPVISEIINVTFNSIRGACINLQNGNVMRIASSSTVTGTNQTAIKRFTKTVSGGTTLQIPDLTSEFDSEDRFRVYLNAGKKIT